MTYGDLIDPQTVSRRFLSVVGLTDEGLNQRGFTYPALTDYQEFGTPLTARSHTYACMQER